MSAAGALAVAVTLAGCGSTSYFAGRNLPPSGLVNRVMIAIQNPSPLSKGGLEIVDAFYDTRFAYNNVNKVFSVGGFSGALPISIQNMPEEQAGAVYGSGDGSLSLVNYGKESSTPNNSGLNGPSSGIFITRDQAYIFAASQQEHVLTIVDKVVGSSYGLNLPGVYRVSVNPGGTVAMAFVQNSNYAYYPRKLTGAETLTYSGGPSNWPMNAEDCEPQNAPAWCLFQAADASGTPLTFDRPIKAIFSADGGTAFVLNCGQECGGSQSSVTLLPTGPMIFRVSQASGTLPSQSSLTNIPIPGGASNALVASTTMYVVGQQKQPDNLFTGYLTVVNLQSNTASAPIGISDGEPGAPSRMTLADDNTLWIAMTKCNNGERYAKGQPYGCLTMYNTSTNTVTLLEPYQGDATGVADVEGLHKVYVVEGGQVYIFSTKDGTAMDNQYVTVTGTASDVAYIDAHSDSNNTVY
ncbi:MAG: hypothetical protein WBD67_12410 [Terracidiphilus sp.]